jgi:hypothetical protein
MTYRAKRLYQSIKSNPGSCKAALYMGSRFVSYSAFKACLNGLVRSGLVVDENGQVFAKGESNA